MYLSIRDVMENKPVSELRRTDPRDGKSLMPWSGKHQEHFRTIQNNWYKMRRDLAKVLLGGLRTQKQIIAGIDRTEGGRRRLTQYLDRIEQYIKIIEFEQTNNPAGRQYDIDQKDLAEWALNYFNDPPYKFKSMRIGQLYAIWYSVFDKKKNLSLK